MTGMTVLREVAVINGGFVEGYKYCLDESGSRRGSRECVVTRRGGAGGVHNIPGAPGARFSSWRGGVRALNCQTLAFSTA